jgi:hypothetical protein
MLRADINDEDYGRAFAAFLATKYGLQGDAIATQGAACLTFGFQVPLRTGDKK